ncbi:hypothetical protein CRG98_031036 [Punica granatum]|uniref:Condensin-2 complex subunit H2 n=1 Tax=Punica granatum TaxID=22663 RepID=A0A2I0IX20_PUNGR|nr:hypothetical protein CRG98_031036 [Punica granatum]
MTNFGDEPSSSSGFHSVHAERDPESNWAVDLDRLLEEYLVKVCSGEIPSEDDDHRIRVNFAEVDAKNSLDSSTDKDIPSNHLVRPPANLVVLEGDRLDASGDSGELESYLLATHDLFEDFILLDSGDAVAVNDFLKDGKVQNGGQRASSARKTFQSPRSRSGAAGSRSSAGKSHGVDMNKSPDAGFNTQVNNFDAAPDPPAFDDFANGEFSFNMDNGYAEPRDDSDDDDNHDPWKPLNPHESGNLKVKPYKKVKGIRKPMTRSPRTVSIMTQFPLARTDGPISPEFNDMWEKIRAARQKQHETGSLPLYEKLRQSLINGGCEVPFGSSDDADEDHGDDGGFADFGGPDTNMPEGTYMDEDSPFDNDDAAPLDNDGAGGNEDPLSKTSLEDLCRSHLDALLASIAETEKQTELAARVSTWKQKIEQNLEEQDSHPPFDIHEYGERIISKLSPEADQGDAMSFADIVRGQEKHDVARSFSALLQLVNNGDVDLDKGKTGASSVCFTAVNPFYVRLCSNTRPGEAQVQSGKKRVTSPIRRVHKKAQINGPIEEEPAASLRSKCRPRELPSQPKFTLKVGKGGGVRCTPEGKKRRKSRFVEPVNLHSAS